MQYHWWVVPNSRPEKAVKICEITKWFSKWLVLPLQLTAWASKNDETRPPIHPRSRSQFQTIIFISSRPRLYFPTGRRDILLNLTFLNQKRSTFFTRFDVFLMWNLIRNLTTVQISGLDTYLMISIRRNKKLMCAVLCKWWLYNWLIAILNEI